MPCGPRYSPSPLLSLPAPYTWPCCLSLIKAEPRDMAVHCGNGFEAGFSPYQNTRLSRYNPVS
jgi:hypothetical protein